MAATATSSMWTLVQWSSSELLLLVRSVWDISMTYSCLPETARSVSQLGAGLLAACAVEICDVWGHLLRNREVHAPAALK